MQRVRVITHKLNPLATIPLYAHNTDSGADIAALEDITIPPRSLLKVRTGLSFEIPYGYELQVRSRSGLASKDNVFVLNSPGTIDTDYRGELQVLLYNMSDTPKAYKAGKNIAQLVLSPVYQASYEELERGDKGFGSTDALANLSDSLPASSPDNVIPINQTNPTDIAAVFMAEDMSGSINGFMSLG